MNEKHVQLLRLVTNQLDYLADMAQAEGDPTAYHGFLLCLRHTTELVLAIIAELENDQAVRPSL